MFAAFKGSVGHRTVRGADGGADRRSARICRCRRRRWRQAASARSSWTSTRPWPATTCSASARPRSRSLTSRLRTTGIRSGTRSAQYRTPMTVEEVLTRQADLLPDDARDVRADERRRGGAGRRLREGDGPLRPQPRGRHPRGRGSAAAATPARGDREAPDAHGGQPRLRDWPAGPGRRFVAELHDATAFAEIMQAEHCGFAPYGEGGKLAESGATRLGGQPADQRLGRPAVKGPPDRGNRRDPGQRDRSAAARRSRRAAGRGRTHRSLRERRRILRL